MSAGIVLRPATGADRDILFRVFASTRDDIRRAPLDDDQKRALLEMQFDAQRTDYRSRYPGSVHSIVVVDGVDVGRIWVERNADEIRLLDIALLPEWRNRGIGRVLLEGLIAEARESGRPIRDSVYKDNPGAFRLYRRLGFEVVDDLEVYWSLEWRDPETG